jgi:protein-tyrosine phosphatase
MTGRFEVLFVSTGNVCRSPLAERIVEHELDVALGPAAAAFRLASAGTWGHDGAAMEPHARQVLVERGVRHSGFVARELLPEHLVVADLVLTGSAEQRHQVTLLDAHAVARAFTLREFARLAEGMNVSGLPDSAPARARELVARMAARRAQLPAALVEDDIADPYGAPLHVFRLCAEQISECLGAFVGLVAGRRLGRLDAVG